MDRTLVFTFLALISTGLIAGPVVDDVSDFEDEFLDELPIVLSASRLAQPLNEAPVAMTVIDREMIDASGARTIPDLLRLVPGFQVGYFDGNSPIATYHGHGDEHSRRVQVLIDGRSVYVPSLAGIQWSDHIVTIDDIARIEVTRGPNATSYGNNSFLAVVNITTSSAIEDQGHKIKIIQGSNETHEGYYRFGDQIGTLDYRVTAGSEHDDGTDLLNDYTRSDFFSYRLDNQIDLNDFLSYQGGYKDIKLGDHEATPNFQIEVESLFQWLKWEHTTSSNNSLTLQYYYNNHNQDITHENLLIAFPFGIDPFPSPNITILSERHDLELTYTLNLERFRLVSGVSGRMDIVSAENVFRTDDTLRHKLYRGFTHGEYKLKNGWIINAGFMIENNDISGSDISPRISFLHNINKNHTIRFGASRATRTPVLFDQNAYLVTNQQLTQNGGQPLDASLQAALGGTDIINLVDLISSGDIDSEEIKSFEFGYISQLLNNKLTVDLKVFKDKTDKLIFESGSPTSVPEDNWDGEADEILNTHKTDSTGTELSLDYKLPKDYRIITRYSYIDISAVMYESLGNLRNTRRLTKSAPKKTFGLTLIKHWPERFDASVNFYYIGDMDWLDRTGSTAPLNEDRSAQPYRKLDIKLSKTYLLGSEQLKIDLTLQNLLEDFFDYNKTRYDDANMSIITADTSTISASGSEQDLRAYLEISLEFY
jgi:iron complex outermembrane recepter protein